MSNRGTKARADRQYERRMRTLGFDDGYADQRASCADATYQEAWRNGRLRRLAERISDERGLSLAEATEIVRRQGG